MSALPPKADMCGAKRDVRFVPIADIAPPYGPPRFEPRLQCQIANDKLVFIAVLTLIKDQLSLIWELGRDSKGLGCVS